MSQFATLIHDAGWCYLVLRQPPALVGRGWAFKNPAEGPPRGPAPVHVAPETMHELQKPQNLSRSYVAKNADI